MNSTRNPLKSSSKISNKDHSREPPTMRPYPKFQSFNGTILNNNVFNNETQNSRSGSQNIYKS